MEGFPSHANRTHTDSPQRGSDVPTRVLRSPSEAIGACEGLLISISVSRHQTSQVRGKYWDLGRILIYPNTKEWICRSQKQHCRATPHCKAFITSFLWGPKDAFPSYTLFSHAGVKERHPDDSQHGSPELSGTQGSGEHQKPWKIEYILPSKKHVFLPQSFVVIWWTTKMSLPTTCLKQIQFCYRYIFSGDWL